MNVSFIIATIGRPSLGATLASVERWPGDEVLVVGNPVRATGPQVRCIPCAPGGDYGHTERNYAMPMARGTYIAHIDDDDVYVPGTRALMEDVMVRTPGRPAIFRMRFPCGLVLWQEPVIRCGGLGTPCFLTPNDPPKLGIWGHHVGGDCAFLESSKWAAEDYVWRPEVIALLGHNV
jgi:hypothetical protein